MLEEEGAILQQSDHRILLRQNFAGGPTVQPVWRERVVQWCYDVVDHLHESRSVVYMAMNILDRYSAVKLSKTEAEAKTYEVASLSAVFLAVRIAGSGNLQLQDLLSMSQHDVCVQDIVSMGTAICEALTWGKLISPVQFIEAFLELLPSLNEAPRRQVILDSATFYTEIAVCDAVLCSSKASSLAVAAILSALRSTLSSEAGSFSRAVARATKISTSSEEIASMSRRLEDLYSQSAECTQASPGPHVILDDEDPCTNMEDQGPPSSSSSFVPRVSEENLNILSKTKRKADIMVIDDVTPLKRGKPGQTPH
jgi:hypothetical protein